MQAIRRIVPRFIRTLSHEPPVTQRLSTPARSLLQQRLYADDTKHRFFPYWSKVLLQNERIRALPYKKRLDYLVTNSANVDISPSTHILIRGLDPSIKFPELEKSSLLSGNVGLSGSIKNGFLYAEFPSQEAASDAMQKINSATEYPFVVEGDISNIILPAYAEYAKNVKKIERIPTKVLYIPAYRGTHDELRAILKPFSKGPLKISERTTPPDRRHIWVDMGSVDNAKSVIESCVQRPYTYGDGQQLSVYYGRRR